MDPQQRLLLELSWQALEDAGYSQDSVMGSATGVFVGASGADYAKVIEESGIPYAAHFATGNSSSILANRLSYLYDFSGPSLQIDTACSSSLVAVHEAVRSLRDGESKMALVCGVHLMCHPSNSIFYYDAGMLSKAGQCRTFDERADGYVRGEGAVVLLLKPIEQALRDGDHVYALIKGTASNHGGRAGGLTVPNPVRQAQLIREAWRVSEVEPASIGLIETHGTGTALGDPIEIRGLSQAFGKEKGNCALGSIKTNIGHLEAAAGIAGLLKTVLCLQHKELPALQDFQKLNSHIKLEGTPFRLTDQHQSWLHQNHTTPRRAGVSSFGSGGSNAHVVLEEWPDDSFVSPELASVGLPDLFVLSARDKSALHDYVERFLRWLNSPECATTSFADILSTLRRGREPMSERLACVVSDPSELRRVLERFLVAQTASGSESVYLGSLDGQSQQSQQFATGTTAHKLAGIALAQGEVATLAALWCAGLTIDWSALAGSYGSKRVTLPTYPFRKERYWIQARDTVKQPAPGARSELAAQQGAMPLQRFEEVWVRERFHALTGDQATLPRAELVVCCLPHLKHHAPFHEAMRALYPETDYRVLDHTIADPGLAQSRLRAVVKTAKLIDMVFLGEAQDVELLAALLRNIRVCAIVPQRLVIAGTYRNGLERCHLESWIGFERTLNRQWSGTVFNTLSGQSATAEGSWGDWVREIFTVLHAPGPSNVLLKDGERYTLTIRPQPLGAKSLTHSGTVLVTGATGALGKLFAQYLAKKGVKRLILNGRSPQEHLAQGFNERLAALGCEVFYLQADVGDTNAMRTGLAQARRRFGAIHGVIHAAGVLGQGRLENNDHGQFQQVLAAKVTGTVTLDRLLAEDPLQYVCYFSSSAALLGDVGSCDYAVANRFLMAYAGHRDWLCQQGERQGKTHVILWPLWREGAMKLGDATQTQAYLQLSGQRELENSEAFDLFDQVLAGDALQTVVLTGKPERIAHFLKMKPSSSASEVLGLHPIAVRPLASLDAFDESSESTTKKKVLFVQTIRRIAAQVLRAAEEELALNISFVDFGFDSILLTRFAKQLSAQFDIEVLASLFFSYGTLEKLVEHLLSKHPELLESCSAPLQQQASPLHEEPFPFSAKHPKPASAQSALNAEPIAQDEPIAVIAASGRFPGAESIEDLWRNLCEGRTGLGQMPAARIASGAGEQTGLTAGYLQDVEMFDPKFFSIPPHEANLMDPRQRLFLQTAWHTLEQAGYTGSRLQQIRCGVYVGVEEGHEGLFPVQGYINSQQIATLAARIAYQLDLSGPAIALSTACSSALVALHQACQALRHGDCELALVGGVGLLLSPPAFERFEAATMLSPTAHCHVFDERADGLVPGEAVAAVLLKSLSAAIRDGDTILGCIAGSGINHNGHTNGITAPSPERQVQLMRAVHAHSNVDPKDVQFVMAHSVGSAVGDLLELDALTTVYTQPQPQPSCAIGSVKPLLGHSFAASGLVSLIATLSALKHKTIPGLTTLEGLKSGVATKPLPFIFAKQTRAWPAAAAANGLRYAAVGASGISGTNAFILLQEYRPSLKVQPPSSVEQNDLTWIVPVSARTVERLLVVVQGMVAHLHQHPAQSLADIAFTLQAGREPMQERLAILARSREELLKGLQDFLADPAQSRIQSLLPAAEGVSAQLELLARRWVAGAAIDWTLHRPRGVSASQSNYIVPLPTYPFLRRVCTRPVSRVTASLPDVSVEPVSIAEAGLPIQNDKKIVSLYEAIAEDGQSEFHGGYVTFFPLPERIPGFSITRVVMDPERYPEEALLVRTQQRECRQVLFAEVPFARVHAVLDFGCGYGTDLIEIAERHRHLTAHGFTISPSQARYASQKITEKDLRAAVFNRDSANEPFPGQYDLTFGLEVSCHIENKDGLFDNIASTLKTDGRLLLMDFIANLRGPIVDSAVSVYISTKQQWGELLATHGLRIEEIIDVSPQIANGLFDPECETNVEKFTPVLRDSWRNWTNNAVAIERGWVSYCLFRIRKDTTTAVEVLRKINASKLEHQTPYAQALETCQTRGAEPELRPIINEVFRRVLELGADELNGSLKDLGLTSLNAVELLQEINTILNLSLPTSLIFEYSSIEALCAYLQSQRPQKALAKEPRAAQTQRAQENDENLVAVVGLACRCAGAPDAQAFWRIISQGEQQFTEISDPAWQAYFERHGVEPVPKRYGALANQDCFDSLFFKISPKEAQAMSAAQRALLEESYHALEDAGIAPESLSEARVGTYVGTMGSAPLGEDWSHFGLLGGDSSIMAARLSYFLNLKGPALAVDTACSSSLVAMDLARRALLNGDVDLAISAGVTIWNHPGAFIAMTRAGMLSPTGRCQPFDDEADGIVVGDGVGVLILKRLADARRDGNHVYGVILGSGTNQDGQTSGITAPSFLSQSRLQSEVYARHQISVPSIQYIEAHGTGTRLGDPVEVHALSESFARATEKKRFCAMGSVKANIGHTGAAAGVLSVIKVLLALHHRQLPPSISFQRENRHVDFANSPVYVNTVLRDWPENGKKPRMAAVNSFGFSGTNAHIVLAQDDQTIVPILSHQHASLLIVLSARNENDLVACVAQLRNFVTATPERELDLQALAYTLQTGRDALQERVVFRVQDRSSLLQLLNDFKSNGAPCVSVWRSAATSSVVFETNQISSDASAEMARAWVQGHSVLWRELYAKDLPHSMSVPGYPFAKERHPLPVLKQAALLEPKQGLHPLVQENCSDLAGQRFSTVLSGNEFFLTDHRVQGQSLLPAVASLEMARVALLLARPADQSMAVHQAVRIEEVVWLRPIQFAEATQSQTLDMKVLPATSGIAFEVYSNSLLHIKGRASLVASSRPTLDLALVAKEMTRECLDHERIYSDFASMGIQYGPTFRCVQKIHLGEEALLAKVHLSTDTLASLEPYVLHPAVLDAALQPLIYLVDAGVEAVATGHPVLPFALKWVEVYGPCSRSMWSVLRRRGDNFDLELCDDSGQIQVRLSGLSVRAANPRLTALTTAQSTLEWSEPVWQEISFSTNPETIVKPASLTLVVGGSEQWFSAFKTVYVNAVKLALPVGQATIEPSQALSDALIKCLSGLPPLEHIVWCAPNTVVTNTTDERLIEAQQVGVLALYRLLKVLLAQGYAARALSWTVLTQGVHSVHAHELNEPAHAGVQGLMGSVAKEYPHWQVRLLDLQLGSDISVELLSRLPVRAEASSFALRHERVLERFLLPRSSSTPAAEALLPDMYKRHGVYVVIGGAGGIGQAWSRWMIERFDAQILWIGRRPEDEEIRTAIEALGRLGRAPRYIQADATDPVDLARAYGLITQSYPRLHGIVHSAIVLRDRTLAKMSEEDFCAGLLPKVDLSVRLAQVFAAQQLDFILFFSSIESFLTLPGQSNYAAGCAFKDAFALRLAQERSCKVVIVNWGYWGSVGVVKDQVHRQQVAQLGFGSIEPREAFDALQTLLRLPERQVALVKRLVAARPEVASAQRPDKPTRRISEVPQSAIIPDEESLRDKGIEYVRRIVAKTLQMSANDIDPFKPFDTYGIDSILAIQLTTAMRVHFESVGSTLFFEVKSIRALVEHLMTVERKAFLGLFAAVGGADESQGAVAIQLAESAEHRARLASVASAVSVAQARAVSLPRPSESGSAFDRGPVPAEALSDIAVIGMEGRFPGAKDLRQFWENLEAGLSSITEVPAERWDWQRYFDAKPGREGFSYSRWGGFIEDVDKFDPLFFQISPYDAERMDPQERLFLECAYSTIEQAGYTPSTLSSEARVGVFVGVMNSMYGREPKAWSIANRVSYQCDFQGPSVAFDTACSSSLTALHFALESLRSGQCDSALVGGVNLLLAPQHYIELSEMTALSPDAQCHPFGARANGFVDAEGVAAVLLKPLAQAIADGDQIYGVLKGSGINAGGKTNGFTVPNPKAQARLISEVLLRSGLSASAVSYVEAHGTGTALGDPIEISGLTQAFKELGATRPSSCAIGSVKANIGHCESAAGMAGLLKVLLQLQHRTLVPSIHSTPLSSHIDFAATPFVVQRKVAEWVRPVLTQEGVTREYPRIAGISSFGAGGANAHVLVQEYVPEVSSGRHSDPLQDDETEYAVVLSAATDERLGVMVANLHHFIKEQGQSKVTHLSDLAYTLQVGRVAHDSRVGIIARNLTELENKLYQLTYTTHEVAGVYRGQVKTGRDSLSIFQADEDLSVAIEAWLTRRKFGKLLELWVKGLVVDWSRLYLGSRAQRVSLPTYPFARERYWSPGLAMSLESQDEVCSAVGVSTTQPEQAWAEAPVTGRLEELMLVPLWNALPVIVRGAELIVSNSRALVVGASASQLEALLVALPQSNAFQCIENESLSALTERLLAQGTVEQLFYIFQDFPLSGLSDDNLIQAQRHGVLALFRLVQALNAAGYADRRLSLNIVTTATLSLEPAAYSNPTHASVHGFVGALAREYSAWRVRLFDLETDVVLPVTEILDVQAFEREAFAEVFVLRAGQWLTQSLVPVQGLAPKPPVYRQGGVYVVIGGAGGIGELWTQYMVEHYQAKVIWLGRRPLNEDIQSRLASLARVGPAPLYLSTDASDYHSLSAALLQIKALHPEIHGVIHSAVGRFDRSIAEMTEAEFQEILSAKIDISVRLVQLFRHESLDFILFFSSISSFIKSGGMSGYSAGCTFQDAYARALTGELSFAVHTVNWGYWNVGTGLAIPESSKLRMQHRGIEPLSAQEGMLGLDYLLASSIPQAVIMKSAAPEALEQVDGQQWLVQGVQAAICPLRQVEEHLPTLGMPNKELKRSAVFYDSELEPLLYRMLHAVLSEQGVLEQGEVGGPSFYRRWLPVARRFLSASPHDIDAQESLEQLWAQWNRQRSTWLQNKDMRAGVVLAEHCLRALPDILCGARPATEILFPNASMELVEGIYKGNLAADHFNDVLGNTLVSLLQAPDLKTRGGIRILEIGAGTGGTSAGVFQKLSPLQEQIAEYCYTDLSKAFLFHALEHFGVQAPYLKTQLFNVALSPLEQGLELFGYDIVIAANVLHATANIRTALRHAKSLLRPGGVLLLNELTQGSLLAHLTFGLLEGWWLNEDESLRIPGSPGLNVQAWKRVLAEEGFDRVVFPAAQSLELGQQIIAAQSDGLVRMQGALNKKIVEDVARTASTDSHEVSEKTVGLRAFAVSFVRALVAKALHIEAIRINPAEPLERYGIDSILIARVTTSLREVFGEVRSTLLYDASSINALVDVLLESYAEKFSALWRLNHPVAPAAALVVDSPTTVDLFASIDTSARVVTSSTSPDREPIAIVGMSGRYAGADNLEEFWQNLEQGLDCVIEIPAERWSLEDFYEPDPILAGATGKSYSKWGSFITGFADFDPLFFNISPQEALCMDPQERLFLQEVWLALEDAGYTREHLALEFTKKVGVFAGVTRVGYGLFGPEVWRAGESLLPYTSFSSVANRVSHFLDLEGPSLAIDAMCSSSLVAIHEACEHIYRGECEVAIAGGVNLFLHPSSYVSLCANRMLSEDGKCRSFGADASGFVPGEGVGVLILKPLSQARQAGERIHAVIRSTQVSHGGKTQGFTVPSPRAQGALVRQALVKAGVNARDVSYIEAHGTGTEMGDPIEIEGLTQAFSQDTLDTGFCAIGSVKSTMGHMEAAAGVAGLTKTILQMKNHCLVPSRHAERLNTEINFSQTPFVVQQHSAPWLRRRVLVEGVEQEIPRIAGVSSFGAGGVNAHVLLEEFTETQAEDQTLSRREDPSLEQSAQAVVLSARTQQALSSMIENLYDFLCNSPYPPRLSDIAYTLQVGRESMEKRLAIVVRSTEALLNKLRMILISAGEVTDPAAEIYRGEVSRYTVSQQASLDLSMTQDHLPEILSQWLSGTQIRWTELHRGSDARCVSLPGYAFAKERFWVVDNLRTSRETLSEPPLLAILGQAAPVKDKSQSLQRTAKALDEKSKPTPVKRNIETQLFKPVWLPLTEAQRPAEAAFATRWIGVCGLTSVLTLCSVGLSEHGDTHSVFPLPVTGEGLAQRFQSAAISLLAQLKNVALNSVVSKTFLQLLVPVDSHRDCLSGLLGMLRTAQAEYPGLTVQLLEVATDVGAADLAEAVRQGGNFYLYDRLRIAGDHAQFLQWCVTDPVPEGAPWREEGVYLITGGAGGLGRIFASDIIRSSAQARVVLVGRSELAEFERLRLSPRLEYRCADVSQQDDVEELIRWLKDKFGRLDGVIHAAGILRDKLLSGKTALEVSDVLAAKVQGTVNLDLATRSLHPELFILCSSCASLRGNPGQADYATANGFMDAYAELRGQEPELADCPEYSLSLNWPLWSDGGMTMDATHQETLSRDTGMVAMPSSVGLESLYASIELARTRSTPARVMVLHGVMKQLIPLFVSAPALSLAAAPKRAMFAARPELRQTIQDALLISRDVELDDRATFLDLGIDSIQMVRFMAGLSRRLNVELAQTLLFEYPTIGTLTDYLFSLNTSSQVLAQTAAAKPFLKPPTGSDTLFQQVAKHPELVLFNGEAEGPLLFCIYPMSGDVGMYAKLAQASQNRYRVLGIKARGLLTEFTPLTTVHAMAEHCARLIATVQPEGDLYLLGTSMGGAVAYETVAELQRQARKVSQLIFLEAPLIATAQQQALWSTERDSNLLMNANFLLITMLHLDPAFRQQKEAGDLRWEDWLLTESDIDGFSVLSSEELLVERLVQGVRARGVKQAPEVLSQRLRSMAGIHLANLQAFRFYRAKPLPTPEGLSVVMLRTKTARAISQDVYNPDYLLNVQHFHDGLSVLLDNWLEVIPTLDVRIVEGENHFELLNTAHAVACVGDLIADLICPSQGRAMISTPLLTTAQTRPSAEAIAVIGMSGRFPGAESLEALWELLRQGKTAFSPLPSDRGWSELWQSREQFKGIGHGGFLTDIDQFDPGYFQIPPKDAQSLDPAERIFLEECWRAIRQAGVDPASLSNANWGVFCGAGGDYTMLIERLVGVSPHVTTSSIAARISYSFGLTGPCVSVDAGCASSLQAIAQACDQLLLGHCEVAIAGGAYVHSTPNLIQTAAASELLSSASHACVLGSEAQGMLPAEGAGVVVLKPLSKALADGDTVHGVIEAWGMNHSGRTNGLSAPSAKAQRALFTALLKRHNIDPASISLIEANANGTPLGDRLEIEALQDVYGKVRRGASPCALGSIEGNIGHPFHSSGVAHLLKVLLSMRARQLAPTVGIGTAHPSLETGNLRLTQTLETWTAPQGQPRRAVVNSFGATGTNVQLILREPNVSEFGSAVQSSTLAPELPFKRRRCWLEAVRVAAPDPVVSPALAQRASIPVVIDGFVREITGYRQGEMSFARPLSHYGVDSLIVMRLLAKLNQYFSLELQLADLAVLESINGLALIIEAMLEARRTASPRVMPPAQSLHAKNETGKWLLERLS